MQSSFNKTVEGAVLFPVARSVALRSFRETITRRRDAQEEDKDAGENVGVRRAVEGGGTETKKARVCFCTCVPSQRRGRFRMQEIGRAPQSERNLQTQFPGQTDGQTNEPARANRGPFAVPTSIWVHPGPDAALIMHRRNFARKNACAASYRSARLSSLKSRVNVKYGVNFR